MNEVALETGTTVRVVDFTPQYWTVQDDDCYIAERTLLECYIGKVGKVVKVDGWKMPYLVEFADNVRVPIDRMRFHADEVEDVG